MNRVKKEVLVSNHIRSLLSDDENNIWIGTNNGVNRYNSTTKRLNLFINSQPVSIIQSIWIEAAMFGSVPMTVLLCILIQTN